MKKLYTLTTALVFGTVCLFGQTADPNANQTTQCILQYMSGLPSQPDNKVISGQWMNKRPTPETPQTEFDTTITSINNLTSKWVGIIGSDYLREFLMPYHQAIKNLSPVNQVLINYFKAGGLVCVMSTLKNPWNNTNANDTTNTGNILDVITTGHPANTRFNQYLDSIAVGFSQLQDSGVTVIYRPFHEQNAPWFWWGSRSATVPSAANFASLWQYTFNYLTNVKQLHNILWMFSPSVKGTGNNSPVFKPELYYYPGNNYVDIIGLDEYKDTLDIPNYSALVATGKPIGFGEFGPSKNTVLNNPFSYDYNILINQIKIKYPALCFWLSWNHFKEGNTTNWVYYSLSTQNNTNILLNDLWVANREDIDYSACLTTSINDNTNLSNSVAIFPNPFSVQTILQSDRALRNATLSVDNVFGQTIVQIKNINGQTVTLQRNALPTGLYFIRLTEDNKQIAMKKIIIAN